MNSTDLQKFYDSGVPAWTPDYKGIEQVINSDRHPCPIFGVSARNVIENYEKRTTLLWTYLLAAIANYRRGAQGIGDCVSWGAELAATILMAKARAKAGGLSQFKPVATEPIYGGSRVEARGKPGGGNKAYGGWSDGSYGAAAADWVHEAGLILRDDYSGQTGNPNHDYRVYNSKKAKNEGAYGAGGQNDGGKIDEIAREMPLRTVSQVGGFDDVAAAIAGSHCPVTNASMYGCSMRRDKKGQCYWTKSWAHQMCWIGVRFGEHPAVLNAQSWGPNVASGPSGDEFVDFSTVPGYENTPDNILGFCWWQPAEDVDRICRSGDCWAFGDVDKEWKIEKFDWSTMWG